MTRNFTLCGATCLILAITATGASAADTKGTGLVCVPIQEIQNTPAIDDKTILLELTGHHYKRMDLAGPCPDVTFHGFRYDTSTNDLCTSNALHVIEPAGAVCMIKDIVDITPDEAKALQHKPK